MRGEFEAAILIGRFQPYHKGHAALLAGALQYAPHVLIVLGSAFHAPNAKNPFSWQERAEMIRSTFDAATQKRLTFLPVRDYYNDQRWCAALRAQTEEAIGRQVNVALIGYEKDASSYYLNLFPNWQYIPLPQFGKVNATSIRETLYSSCDWAEAATVLTKEVPEQVLAYLKNWSLQSGFARLKTEYQALAENRRRWGDGPFVTADALVTLANHVLLIERKHMPGQGLLALPGGFLELRERLLQCAIRELKEETGLQLSRNKLEESLRAVTVFDHPDRSLRGRTITHAHWFDLGDGTLPALCADDDAAHAQWFPIAALRKNEDRFFDDHFHILNHFLDLEYPV